MKNFIICLALCLSATLSGCDKSQNLKENCYKAKVLFSGECGNIVQIVSGSPSLENSIWYDLNGKKFQRSYLVDRALDGYSVGQTIYVQAKNLKSPPSMIRPANCPGLPEYLLEIEIVDSNCELIENKM